MAFPREFTYTDEDAFIQQFLIPLLQRLGFSLVINYHGRTEFGKDLIFAEIDRFGHVRYHALQAKYDASISLNRVEDLIRDCKQAFSNPFAHPQTGTIERISSFYAVNGGSLGPEAVQHYFNSLLPFYGGNARLLQGRDLLTLDRWASNGRTDNVDAVVTGLLVELRFNRRVAPTWREHLERSSSGELGVPFSIFQMKVDAYSTYLEKPVLRILIDTDEILQYWHIVTTLNRRYDLATQGLLPPDNRQQLMIACLRDLARLETQAALLETKLMSALRTLGPMVAL